MRHQVFAFDARFAADDDRGSFTAFLFGQHFDFPVDFGDDGGSFGFGELRRFL